MPGRARAVANGNQLVGAVSDMGRELGLEVKEQVRVARRIWGAIRRIDVVLTHPETRKTLGVECKYQSGGGTAEEKIPATIQDICRMAHSGNRRVQRRRFHPEYEVLPNLHR